MTTNSQTALQPSTVAVELRAGWPMYVGVLRADRAIVWRSPVARCRDTEALADAVEASELGLVGDPRHWAERDRARQVLAAALDVLVDQSIEPRLDDRGRPR